MAPVVVLASAHSSAGGSQLHGPVVELSEASLQFRSPLDGNLSSQGRSRFILSSRYRNRGTARSSKPSFLGRSVPMVSVVSFTAWRLAPTLTR